MKSLFLLLLSLLVSTASAQVITIDERKTDIYFGNGVWNDNIQADDGRSALETFIIDNLAKPDTKVKLAFNNTNGHRKDLVETYYQLALLGQISVGYFTMLSEVMTSSVPSVLKPIYLAGMVSEERKDLDVMVKSYKDDISQGHKVLLVSHSQGNLFGLRAFDELAWEKKYFLQLSIASPASRVANDGEWITNIHDFVIKQLIDLTIIENSLDANAAISTGLNDLSGHKFVTYLGGVETAVKIKGALSRSLDKLNKVSSQWNITQEDTYCTSKACSEKKVYVTHVSKSYAMNEKMSQTLVYPFNSNGKLYSVAGGYVKGGEGGEKVIDNPSDGICFALGGTDETISGEGKANDNTSANK